jgi:hypothetical protein
LAARWRRFHTADCPLAKKTKGIEAQATIWYRSNGAWWSDIRNCEVGDGKPPTEADIGEPVPDFRAYDPLNPIVQIRHLDYYGLDLPFVREESVLDTWADYFPGIPEEQRLTFEYPEPLSDEFWHLYSEPVEHFLRYAVFLLGALRPEPIPSYLESLVDPIGLSLEEDENGHVAERWRCPSLLSALAKMAIQDACGGFRILACESCGTPFVSSAYQARYCSQTCAWRHRKHRSRLRAPTQAESVYFGLEEREGVQP